MFCDNQPWTWTGQMNPWALSTHVYTAQDMAKDKDIFTLQARILELEGQLGNS